jgi:hypothetical protein
MPKFRELTESATQRPIHINPSHVRFVRSDGAENAQIDFDEEHSLGVLESPAVVRQRWTMPTELKGRSASSAKICLE